MRSKTFFKTLIPFKTLLLILVYTLSFSTLWSQTEICGTDSVIIALMEKDEEYKAAFIEANQQITDAINQNPNIGGQLVEIPVVVHIMHNETEEVNENIPEQQVHDAIQLLNDQFAGLEANGHPIFNHNTLIRFTLAKIDHNGNCTNGIVRVHTDSPFGAFDDDGSDLAMKNLSRWPAENYLNIWVVQCIWSNGETNGEESCGGIGGYVYPPPANELTDGVVIRYDILGNTFEASQNLRPPVLTHEVGHYLSLHHVWGSAVHNTCEERCHSPNPPDCNELGDFVCDTAPCFGPLYTANCDQLFEDQCLDSCSVDIDMPYPKESYMSYTYNCQTGFSPEQSDRMHGTIDEFRPDLVSAANLLNTGINLIFPPQQDVTISQNTTWGLPNVDADRGAICIDGTVTIESGATLTVSPGVIVMFDSDSEVIVQPNAQLLMNGSTFTACDTWQGIQVLGNSNLNQTAANQGRVFMNNGATIEHAEIGVITGSLSEGTTGGIVQAFNGSTFRNNVMGVAFQAYENITCGTQQNNISSFNLCHSIINDDYRFSNDEVDGKLKPFILMSGVNGVTVRGHHFRDQRSIIDSLRPSGKTGIAADFSGFNVNEWCPGISPLPAPPTCEGTRTRFDNLGYSIHARNINHPSFNINVRNSDFNGWHGIYLDGINAPQIYINNFFVRQVIIPDTESENPLLIHSYGIYLDNCTNYNVEENYLEGQVDVGAPPSMDEHAGIIVRNNHEGSETIYNNQFHHLSTGVEGVSQNRDEEQQPNLAQGLRFECNDFTETRVDMFVMEDLDAPQAVPIAGIAPIQDLTANLFSTTNSARNIWRHIGVEPIEYIHHDESTVQRLKPTWAEWALPVAVTGSNIVYEEDEACSNNILPKMKTSIGMAALLNTKNDANSEYRALLGTLRNLTDNGNTPQMLAWVQLANDAAAADEVYTKIMQQAPFTSDAVLEAFSKKESGFSVDMIRDILCQHPQAAKSEQIKENLDLRLHQLPQTMRDQINEGRNIRSEKEQMELHAARHKRTRDRIISRAIQQLAADTIDRSTDMIKFLKNTGSISFDYRLAEIYDAQNKNELANQTLSSIGTRAISEKAASDYDDYMNFRTMMQTWKAAEKDLSTLTDENIQVLHQYAVRPNITSAKAIALLELNNIFEYTERVYFPDMQEITQTSDESEGIDIGDKLLLYPNPAQSYITVDYKTASQTNDLSLVITDIMGKVIYEQKLDARQSVVTIPTLQYPNGQYFCTLKRNNKTIITEKVILIK